MLCRANSDSVMLLIGLGLTVLTSLAQSMGEWPGCNATLYLVPAFSPWEDIIWGWVVCRLVIELGARKFVLGFAPLEPGTISEGVLKGIFINFIKTNL